MWNELESYKNHFLQWKMPEMKAERINELVRKEFKVATKKRDRCKFPTELECKHSTYFDDRAKLAYGWFALPKLMREVHSKNQLIQWRAINTLSEFLLNPLQAQRAINEMDIVQKLHNWFMRIQLGYQKQYYSEVSKILRIFEILSNYLNGAQQIARKEHLINTLYSIIYNKEKHAKSVAKILRNLSEKTEVLLYLVEEEKPFRRLTRIFHKDPCVPFYDHELWMHLSHFLEVAPEVALKNGFFELLNARIETRQPEYHRMNMKCFALLLRCSAGQNKFDVIDGVKMLHHICSQEQLDTYEYTLLALLQGLHSKKALWRCREFTDLPTIVLNHGKETANNRLQQYSLQTLRQLGEMPCIKRYMHLVCLKDLRTMVTCDEINECIRDDLVSWLGREIYETNGED